MRASSLGATSQRIASARGNSSTRLDVTISPPSSDSCAASASTSACEPPRGNGQPSTCAAAQSARPKPAVAARSSGTAECAALPANSARPALGREQPRDRARAEEPADERRPQPQQVPPRPAPRPRAHERIDERAVVLRVGAEAVGRLLQSALEGHSVAVERVRSRDRRVDPLDVDALERRRAPRERQDRRAHVVSEPRQRELGGAAAAADRVAGLVNGHADAFAHELHRGREPVRARADDDGALQARCARSASAASTSGKSALMAGPTSGPTVSAAGPEISIL